MRALITGIAGMDGSHLADHLLARGYEVHGLVRRHSVPRFDNVRHLLEKDAIHLHEGDLLDHYSLEAVVRAVNPDEVYNLAAQSHVGTSFEQPEYTLQATGLGAHRLFRAVRDAKPSARVYQASSSEMYGNVISRLGLRCADATTPFLPVSPYGIAKHMAHNFASVYRQQGLWVACGILFNHESERRGHNFVTRKITRGLARMKLGLETTFKLGNLGPVRDWGYAPEYVEGMRLLLATDAPADHILATGQGHTVADWLSESIRAAGFSSPIYHYANAESIVNLEEVVHPRIVEAQGEVSHVELDDGLRVDIEATERRPIDISYLVGDANRAREEIGWVARTDFHHLVEKMMRSDLRLVSGQDEGVVAHA